MEATSFRRIRAVEAKVLACESGRVLGIRIWTGVVRTELVGGIFPHFSKSLHPDKFVFPEPKCKIHNLSQSQEGGAPIGHSVGKVVLVALAFALRLLVGAFLLPPGRTVDISIDNVLRPVPLSAVVFCVFWFLIGIACVLFLVDSWASIHRHF